MKCGHEYNAYLEACPQCGYNPKKEAEKKAEAEAQRLRFKEAREEKRRKQEEAEARDALLLAEKRKAWWKENKTKVIVAILTIITLIIGVIVYQKIAEKNQHKKVLAQANAYIASGDSCVAICHFEDAQEFYDKAKHTDVRQELLSEILEKEAVLRGAKNKADQECQEAPAANNYDAMMDRYEEALRNNEEEVINALTEDLGMAQFEGLMTPEQEKRWAKLP